MSDYRVLVLRSNDPDAKDQPFYVKIQAANGEALFVSERYANRLHAVSIAEEFAGMLNGNLIDET